MAKFLLIFICSFFFQIFVFELSAPSANTFKLNSYSVEGNQRISDEAIFNYSELTLTSTVSNEDLSRAYKNIVSSELFNSVKFIQRDGNLKISVQEYPTVNKISFEGNTKFIGAEVMSSDLRASVALVLAASVAQGRSVINRIYHLDRGYEKIENKLKNIGVKIKRLKR